MDGSRQSLFGVKELFILQLLDMTLLSIIPYNPFINFSLHHDKEEH